MVTQFLTQALEEDLPPNYAEGLTRELLDVSVSGRPQAIRDFFRTRMGQSIGEDRINMYLSLPIAGEPLPTVNAHITKETALPNEVVLPARKTPEPTPVLITPPPKKRVISSFRSLPRSAPASPASDTKKVEESLVSSTVSSVADVKDNAATVVHSVLPEVVSPDDIAATIVTTEVQAEETVLYLAGTVNEQILSIAAYFSATHDRPASISDVRKTITMLDIENSEQLLRHISKIHGRTVAQLMALPAETEESQKPVPGQTLRRVIVQMIQDISAAVETAPTVQDLLDALDDEDCPYPDVSALQSILGKLVPGLALSEDALLQQFPLDATGASVLDSPLKTKTNGKSSPMQKGKYRKGNFAPPSEKLRTIGAFREKLGGKKHRLMPDPNEDDPVPELSDASDREVLEGLPALDLGADIESDIAKQMAVVHKMEGGITSARIYAICRSVCLIHADRSSAESVAWAIYTRNRAIAELHEHFQLADAGSAAAENITLPVSKPVGRYCGPLNTTVKNSHDKRFPNRAEQSNADAMKARLNERKAVVVHSNQDEDCLPPETHQEKMERQRTNLLSVMDLVLNKYTAEEGDGGEDVTDQQLQSSEELESEAVPVKNGKKKAAKGEAKEAPETEEGEFVTDPEADTAEFMALGIDPYRPTTAKPGSAEKVLYLSARRAAGVSFWHPEDRYNHASAGDKMVDGEWLIQEAAS